MPSYGTTSLLNNVSNQKINHSGHIFQCLGHKLNENFTAIQMAGPMGQTVPSGTYSVLASP